MVRRTEKDHKLLGKEMDQCWVPEKGVWLVVSSQTHTKNAPVRSWHSKILRGLPLQKLTQLKSDSNPWVSCQQRWEDNVAFHPLWTWPQPCQQLNTFLCCFVWTEGTSVWPTCYHNKTPVEQPGEPCAWTRPCLQLCGLVWVLQRVDANMGLDTQETYWGNLLTHCLWGEMERELERVGRAVDPCAGRRPVKERGKEAVEKEVSDCNAVLKSSHQTGRKSSAQSTSSWILLLTSPWLLLHCIIWLQ